MHQPQMYNDVLNDELVIFPVGNDSENFVPSIKNTYEQALSKCEDERYEMDMLIEINMSTLRVLERVQDKIKKMTPDEAMRFRLDGRLGGASTTVHFTALKRLYDTRVKDVIEGLKKNPKDAIPVVLRRLRAKNTEWMQALIANGRQWRNIHEKSVLKSLDARAPNGKFRYKDKDALLPSRIVSEIASETSGSAGLCQADEGVDVGSSSKGSPKRSVFEDKPGFSVSRKRTDADGPNYNVCMSDAEVLGDVAALVKHCIEAPRDGVTTTTSSKQGKQEKGGAPNNDSIKKGFTATPTANKKKAIDFLQDIVLSHLSFNTSTQDKKQAQVLYCDSVWVSVFRLLQVLYLRLCEAKRLCHLASEGKVYSTLTLAPPTPRHPPSLECTQTLTTTTVSANANAKGVSSGSATPRTATPNGTSTAPVSRNGSKPASPGPPNTAPNVAPKPSLAESPEGLYAAVVAKAKDFVMGVVDHSVFEDYIRNLIGVKAFELYSLDRAVHTLGSQLVSAVESPLYNALTDALCVYEDKLQGTINEDASTTQSLQGTINEETSTAKSLQGTIKEDASTAKSLQGTIKEDASPTKSPYTVYSESVRALLSEPEAQLFRISFSSRDRAMDISAVSSEANADVMSSDENFASQYANKMEPVTGAAPKVPPVYLARNCEEAAAESVGVNKVAARFCLATNKMVYVRNTFDFSVRPDRVVLKQTDRATSGGKRRRTALFPCTDANGSGKRSRKRKNDASDGLTSNALNKRVRADGSKSRVFDERYQASLRQGSDGDGGRGDVNTALQLLGKLVDASMEESTGAELPGNDEGPSTYEQGSNKGSDNGPKEGSVQDHTGTVAGEKALGADRAHDSAQQGEAARSMDSGESDYEMILADDGDDD